MFVYSSRTWIRDGADLHGVKLCPCPVVLDVAAVAGFGAFPLESPQAGKRRQRTDKPTMEPGASPEKHLPECDFDPERLSLRVRVTLAADRKSVDPVVEQVMQAVRQAKCVDGKEDAIELSLEEALANAVVHGAKEDPTKIVECLVACDEQRGVLIIVRDPGEGFDPKALPGCTVGESLYSSHGRGIFLINQLMDEVTFRKNGTEIHMVKR